MYRFSALQQVYWEWKDFKTFRLVCQRDLCKKNNSNPNTADNQEGQDAIQCQEQSAFWWHDPKKIDSGHVDEPRQSSGDTLVGQPQLLPVNDKILNLQGGNGRGQESKRRSRMKESRIHSALRESTFHTSFSSLKKSEHCSQSVWVVKISYHYMFH